MDSFITDSLAESFISRAGFSLEDTTPGFTPYSVVKRKEPIDVNKLIEGYSRDELNAKLMIDLNFLAKFMLPAVCKDDFPPLLVTTWKVWIQNLWKLEEVSGEFKAATAIPRGFTKTTLMKLLIAYAILFTSKTFIVVVGSIVENAENIIADVVDMLSQSQVIMLFGDWRANVERKSKEMHKFRLGGKDIILKPKGGVTSVRGINVKNRRPDFILMDDVQNEENAKSPKESQTLSDWVFNTLIPCISTEGGMVLFVGNVYPYEGDILRNFVKLSSWLTLVLGAILSDGSSLWESLHPKAKLVKEYKEKCILGKSRAWLAQFMNALEDEVKVEADLKRIGLQFSNYFQDIHYDGELMDAMYSTVVSCRYLVVDVATDKKDADNHAFVVADRANDANVARAVRKGIYSPQAAVIQAISLALEYNIPFIFVEDVAYQYTFIQWLRAYLQQAKLTEAIKVFSIKPAQGKKTFRIRNMVLAANEGELLMHPEYFPYFKAEVKKFDPEVRDNDDNVLDATHYIPQIWEKYKGYMENHYFSNTLQLSMANASVPNANQLPDIGVPL